MSATLFIVRPDLANPDPLPDPEAPLIPAAGSAPNPPAAFPVRGDLLWQELHLRALSWGGGGDDSPWLDAFAQKLPCGHCRAHWLGMMQRTPPDFSTRREYFVWTISRHNEVNAKLGKPIMSPDDAAIRWACSVDRRH